MCLRKYVLHQTSIPTKKIALWRCDIFQSSPLEILRSRRFRVPAPLKRTCRGTASNKCCAMAKVHRWNVQDKSDDSKFQSDDSSLWMVINSDLISLDELKSIPHFWWNNSCFDKIEVVIETLPRGCEELAVEVWNLEFDATGTNENLVTCQI